MVNKHIVFLISVTSGEEYDAVQEKASKMTNESTRSWRVQTSDRKENFLSGINVIRLSFGLSESKGCISQDRISYYETSIDWANFKKIYLTAEEFLNDNWNDPRGFIV